MALPPPRDIPPSTQTDTDAGWTTATLSRRRLLAAGGGLMIAAMVDGGERLLSPAAARAAGVTTDPLSATEDATLTRLGNILTVNGGDAGLAQFVSAQLRKTDTENLLILRYFDVPPPYTGFYKSGLAAVDKAARARHSTPFADLDHADAEQLVRDMGADSVPHWSSPVPASFFYFVVRADAIDVTYGTMEGFAALDMPYMSHIDPDPAW